MTRTVQPELLDTLPPGDLRAVRSRRDLHRVNGWMRNHALMARAMQQALNNHPPEFVTDLGAGDGYFLLRVAQWLGGFSNRDVAGLLQRPGAAVSATLLDTQNLVGAATLASLAALGWHARSVVADVFDWPRTPDTGGVVIANLFLHHFQDAQLGALLRLISQRAGLFIAIEPRRAPLALLGARLLRAIGCNEITRHDAVTSVRAGFSGGELSALWPDLSNWEIEERRAGAFSHLFVARRRN